MGLTPDGMGDDVYGYAWAKDYIAAAPAAPAAPVA
jgi:toluene monooxygenase system protein A